ncbi:protein spaetzle isoform X2 [Andrena cerasifolii]|uniref:protein spaetzle isoform X2 n=1 Tax=Andrena cerasifolii TaxID=2819439 RepID=UPI004037C903
MGRGYGGAILALVELCLLVALTAQDVDAYPHRSSNHSKGNVDHYVDNSERSFQPTFVRRQTRDNVERLNEKALEPERLDSNDRLHGRARRDAVKPQPRSFIGLRKQGTEMQSDGKIVFPGEINQKQNHHVPSCEGSTYCVTAENYPEDLVNNAIQRNENLKYLASVDIMPDIAQRIDAMDDVPLCVSTEQVIYPQSGETKDNQWKFIVNQDNFKQGIHVEKCVKEDVSCSTIGATAEGYTTSCKQKYVYRQLASVQANNTIVQDTFRFPSSCCCHVSFTESPHTRLGVNIKDQRSQVSPAKTRRRK